MKCFVPLLLLSLLPVAALADSGEFSSRPGPKVRSSSPPPPTRVQVVGDNASTPIVITSLPYVTSGTTCGFTDDYTPPCVDPFFGGGSPDVVYAFTPTVSNCVTIDLCGGTYDEVVHVHAGVIGNVIACNDDACGATGLQSRLDNVPLVAGTTYYIVVDGWGGACGSYTLQVTPCPPPCTIAPCPAGSLAEGEPVCADQYLDTYDGGCNSSPPAFRSLGCNDGSPITVCGTYGTYVLDGNPYRDTDWYQLTLPGPATVTASVTGETSTQLAILDGNAGCAGVFARAGSVFSSPCQPVSCSAALPAGTYWVFVAPQAFAGVPCGAHYTLQISGYSCGGNCTPIGNLHCNTAAGVPLLLNTTQTVCGVVTGNFPTGSSSRFYIQDDTGGINVFGTPLYCGPLGTRVQVTGTIGQFNGQTELASPLTINVLSVGNPDPAPLLLTPAEFNGTFHADNCEPNEARLVEVKNVFVRSSTGSTLPPGTLFTGNTNYQLVSNTPDATVVVMRVVSSTNGCPLISPLVGTPVPDTCPLDVVGVVVQFDTSSPFTGDYQLTPRGPADLILDCATPAPTVTWGKLRTLYR